MGIVTNTSRHIDNFGIHLFSTSDQYINNQNVVGDDDIAFELGGTIIQGDTSSSVYLNSFPSGQAFDSKKTQLGIGDISVVYEDIDFIDKSDMYVYFYDYDGSIAYKYNINEYFLLDELPPLPDHTNQNVICDRWNWTHVEILSYLETTSSDVHVGCTSHCGIHPESGSSVVRFFDCNGLELGTFHASAFTSTTGTMPLLPQIPERPLISAQWNWSYSEIREHLLNVDDDVNVGLTCGTSGLTTYITCEPTPSNPTVKIKLQASVASVVGILWGDEANEKIARWTTTNAETKSHTYKNLGPTSRFTIQITTTTAATYSFPAYICGTEADNKASTLTDVKLSSQVTSLGNACFKHCSSLKSVTIPSSYTSIGGSCFYNCYSLQSITIPSGVTSIQNYCFYRCYSLQSVAIPNSVTRLGDSCFQYCYSLQSVTIPNSVTSIGTSCFSDCSSLQSVTIPDNVTSLGMSCFYNCYSLQSITIPSGVTSIGSSCFNQNFSLKNIIINSGVTSIGSSCFNNARILRTISLPNSVTSLEARCFSTTRIESITIPNSVRNIGEYCLYNTYIYSLSIPINVESIGVSGFSSTSNLSTLFCFPTTPPTITNGSNIFTNSGINLYVPSKYVQQYQDADGWCLYSAKTHAFNTFQMSGTLGFNQSIKNIEMNFVPTYKLYDTFNKEQIYVISNTFDILKQVNFFDYNGVFVASFTKDEILNLTELPPTPDNTMEGLICEGWNWTLDEIKQQITDVGGDVNVGAIYHTTDGNTYITCKPTETNPVVNICLTPTVANSVTIDWGDGNTDTFTSAGQATKTHTYTGITDVSVFDIKISCSSGTYRFSTYICGTQANNKASTFTDVKLSSKVTSLGTYCFANHKSLQSVAIPNSVTAIGDRCFLTCPSLKSITIPNSVTSLPTSFFDYCYSLKSITIPNSVRSLGNSCFYNCKSLQSVTIPNSITSLGDSFFGYCYSLQSITIPSSITSLGNSCFASCYSLKSITIPIGVTSIGGSCFNYCSSLQSVTIPSGVTSIGNSCFGSCYSLKSITIPNSVTSLGNSCFNYCSSLQSVTIPNNVTSLGDSCFMYCNSLSKIDIPSNITSIGSNCFANCLVTSISVPNVSALTVAFYGCNTLKEITLPTTLRSISGNTFYNCTSLMKITSLATTPPSVSVSNFLQNAHSALTIYVPSAYLSTYQSATNWSTYSSRMRGI